MFAYKRKFEHEDVSVPPQAGPDVAVILVKIQQQLALLEKKIDSLTNQNSERPFKSERYSKPFQRFDHFRRHEKRERGDSYSERRFTKAICADCHKECEVPFKPTGDRPVYCKDCFSKQKQGGSEKDFTQRQHSDNKPGRKSQGRGGRESVSRRRKERD